MNEPLPLEQDHGSAAVLKPRSFAAVLVGVLLFAATPTSEAQGPRSAPSWEEVAALNWPRPTPDLNGYADAERTAMWTSVYEGGGTELYCRTLFTPQAAAARRIGENRLSLEHAYPAGLIARHFGLSTRDCEAQAGPEAGRARKLCLAAVADLHNLWPAYERLNQSRGMVPYGELAGEGTTDTRWISFCPDIERRRGRHPVVEPTQAARGDVARSILYMHFVYGLPVKEVVRDRNILLEWIATDPPDAEERLREDRIEALRPGSRSPLVH